MVTSMVCEEKERSMSEYREATERFSAAVTDQQRKMGTSSLIDYQRLQRIADEARLKPEQARLALESHVVTHQC
jgi:hypothetical protein